MDIIYERTTPITFVHSILLLTTAQEEECRAAEGGDI